MMKLHFIQHVPFEDLARIQTWADSRGIAVTKTALYQNQPLPLQDEFDILVVMGGPMGVYDEDEYSWLTDEKIFIEQTMSSSKPVLGICLGAQLIASVCGAKVYKNEHKEIGFFDVARVDSAQPGALFASVPEKFTPFHWHGDTFELPNGANHLASSDACKNQAFQLSDRVLGLQFHLESTPASVDKLLLNCSDELVDAPYIQSSTQIKLELPNLTRVNPIMDSIMDNLVKTIA